MFSNEFMVGWEENLNSFCEEIEACKGAVELVANFAKMGIPMAIATSSRSASVEKKRKRLVESFVARAFVGFDI